MAKTVYHALDFNRAMSVINMLAGQMSAESRPMPSYVTVRTPTNYNARIAMNEALGPPSPGFKPTYRTQRIPIETILAHLRDTSHDLPAPNYGFRTAEQAAQDNKHHNHGFSAFAHGAWGSLGNALGTPLAAVTSGTKEISDLATHFKHAGGSHSTASIRDFWNQIYHPQQRLDASDLIFGNADKGIPTTVVGEHVKNPYQRLAIGLGADIGIDPLTYVRGVGPLSKLNKEELAGEVAKNAARQAGEAAAAHAGLAEAPEDLTKLRDLLRTYKNEEDVKQILDAGAEATKGARRLGVRGLTDAHIQQFLSDAEGKPLIGRGLSFAGKGKIPLTDIGPAGMLGEGLARGKAALGDAFLGSKASGILETDRELKLAQRAGTPRESFEATLTRLAKGGMKAEARSTAKSLATDFRNIVGGLTPEEKDMAYHIAGGAPAEGASETVQLAAKNMREFFDNAHQAATDAGVKIGMVENYLPRTISEADHAILERAGLVKAGRGFGGPHFFGEIARSLKPDEAGDYHFLGQTFQADSEHAVREQVTNIAREAVAAKSPELAQKLEGFFNPNIDQSVAKYVSGLSNRIALSHAAQKLASQGIEVGGVPPTALQDVAGAAPKALEAGAPEAAPPARFIGGTEPVDLPGGEVTDPNAQRIQDLVANGTITPQEANDPAVFQHFLSQQPTITHAEAIRNEMRTLADRAQAYQDAVKATDAALKSGDMAGAQDAFAHALGSAMGYTSGLDQAGPEADKIRQIVENHFPLGPGGEPIADTARLRKTLQGTMDAMKQHGLELRDELHASQTTRPTIIDTLAGDARVVDGPAANTARSAARAAAGFDERTQELLREAPEQTQQRMDALQNEVETVQRALDSGSVKVTPSQQRDLYEYMLARQEQIGAMSARLNDPENARAAALAEGAAELRAQLATTGEGLAKQAVKYGDMSDRQLKAISELVRRGAADELAAGVGTPKHVADWLGFAARLQDPQELRTILKGWDHVVRTLRNYEMLYPGFYPKIFFGHYLNNLPAGVKIADYISSIRVLGKDIAELSPEEAARAEFIRKSIGVGLVEGQYDSPRDAFEALIGRPTKGTWSPLSPRFKVFNATRALGEKITNTLRGALANRVFEEGGTVDQAIQRIAHYQFDYTDLTPVEQNLRRHLIPFYTFTRNNLPLQIEQLMKNPKYMERFFIAKRQIESMSSPDQVTPDYFKSMFTIRLPFQNQGGAVYLNPAIPQQELPKFLNEPEVALNNAFAMVSPLVKAPIEARLGKTFQESIPLSTTKFVPVPKPIAAIPWLNDALDRIGIYHNQDGHQFMNARDAYLVEQFIPVISRWRRTMPQESGYQDRRITSLLSFIGVPTLSNTAAQQAGQLKGSKDVQKLNKQRQNALRKAVQQLEGTAP